MYEVNQMGILFASRLLDDLSIVDRYIDEAENGKRWLVNELRNLGFDVIDTETNFIHVDFGLKLEKILSGFRSNEILVRGGLPVAGYANFFRFITGRQVSMERVLVVVSEAIGCLFYRRAWSRFVINSSVPCCQVITFLFGTALILQSRI